MKFKDIKLSTRERVLTGLTLIVAAFGFFKYWYIPKHQDIKKVEVSIQELRSEISANSSSLESLETKQKTFGQSPSSDQSELSPGTLFDHSIEAAQQVGVVMKRMRQDKTEATDLLSIIHTEVQIESDFLKLGQFLDRVEKGPVATEVSQISITRIADDLRHMRVDLKLKSYFPKGHQ